MPRPTVRQQAEYYTISTVSTALGLTMEQTRRRIHQGLFPSPTKVTPTHVQLFDAAWVVSARARIRRVVAA